MTPRCLLYPAPLSHVQPHPLKLLSIRFRPSAVSLRRSLYLPYNSRRRKDFDPWRYIFLLTVNVIIMNYWIDTKFTND